MCLVLCVWVCLDCVLVLCFAVGHVLQYILWRTRTYSHDYYYLIDKCILLISFSNTTLYLCALATAHCYLLSYWQMHTPDLNFKYCFVPLCSHGSAQLRWSQLQFWWSHDYMQTTLYYISLCWRSHCHRSLCWRHHMSQCWRPPPPADPLWVLSTIKKNHELKRSESSDRQNITISYV